MTHLGAAVFFLLVLTGSALVLLLTLRTNWHDITGALSYRAPSDPVPLSAWECRSPVQDAPRPHVAA